MAPTLIYCAAGNARYAQIAINCGMLYGAQLPGTIYHPPYFVDQNWRKPNREKYMAALAKHKPHMATVLDWEHQEQLPEVLGWAEDAAQFVDAVVIVPKVQGGVTQLPRTVGGKMIRLGYSVPTKYGGTPLPLWEFAGWPIHLLGGGVTTQINLSRYLTVQSADSNLARKIAELGTVFDGKRWVRLEAYLGMRYDGKDMIYTAFEISCRNIKQAWDKLAHHA